MLKRMLVVVLLVAVLLGSALSPTHAAARVSAAGCYYASKFYSNGSVIKQEDGNYYKCANGSWILHGTVGR
jgi:hypothetical protein